MRPISFEPVPTPAAADPARMDVALFVGLIGGLAAGRPVPVESADELEELGAEPVRPDGLGCTLVRAVAAFFRHGGRRAWIVPVGEPGAYATSSRAERLQRLLRLLGTDEPEMPDGSAAAALPLPPLAGRRELPERWQGPAAALRVEDAFFLCLPDLAELVSPPPEGAPLALDPAIGPPEIFVPCIAPPSTTLQGSADRVAPPALDSAGLVLWQRVVSHLLAWLAAEAPDRMLLLSLPPGATGLDALQPGEALHLCQIAQPWLATPDAADLSGGLMPAEAVLAGLLAGHTLTRGCFLSAGGLPVAEVGRLGETLADPDGRTARFETGLDGTVLVADRTPSRDLTNRHAAVRRLTALLLRTAARLGAEAVFEPAGERLWRDLEIRLELLLERILALGGLRGRDAREAFAVRCGAGTMSAADIAAGRVIAEVGFAPALAVERLAVRLALAAGGR